MTFKHYGLYAAILSTVLFACATAMRPVPTTTYVSSAKRTFAMRDPIFPRTNHGARQGYQSTLRSTPSDSVDQSLGRKSGGRASTPYAVTPTQPAPARFVRGSNYLCPGGFCSSDRPGTTSKPSNTSTRGSERASSRPPREISIPRKKITSQQQTPLPSHRSAPAEMEEPPPIPRMNTGGFHNLARAPKQPARFAYVQEYYHFNLFQIINYIFFFHLNNNYY